MNITNQHGIETMAMAMAYEDSVFKYLMDLKLLLLVILERSGDVIMTGRLIWLGPKSFNMTTNNGILAVSLLLSLFFFLAPKEKVSKQVTNISNFNKYLLNTGSIHNTLIIVLGTSNCFWIFWLRFVWRASDGQVYLWRPLIDTNIHWIKKWTFVTSSQNNVQ